MQRLTAIEKELDLELDKFTDNPQGKLMHATDFSVFKNFDPDKYAAEADQRWGKTDAYQISSTRTKKYTKADWLRHRSEADALDAQLADCISKGMSANDTAVLEIVEGMRRLIDRWFYPCSRQMHANLGAMYVADERFTATYDNICPGMAQFLCDATAANLERGE